jgi:hypothetical protein
MRPFPWHWVSMSRHRLPSTPHRLPMCPRHLKTGTRTRQPSFTQTESVFASDAGAPARFRMTFPARSRNLRPDAAGLQHRLAGRAAGRCAAQLPQAVILRPPISPACVSSPFGPRVLSDQPQAGSYHNGIDLPAPAGAPILATAPGTVIRIQKKGRGAADSECRSLPHGGRSECPHYTALPGRTGGRPRPARWCARQRRPE